MIRAALLAASMLVPLAAGAVPLAARAAEPVRIGITTILSGSTADRGQSEQYGAQIALDEINQAGGVLGRPVEAFYADNACKPDVGVPAVRRLIEQEHVPVLIGALCTPVTHAIMPLVQQDRIPLVIATSAGQDFVDASGTGGNPYAFKTIPSEVDIAQGLMRYLVAQKVASVAIVADAGGFPHANAVAMAAAAKAAGIGVTAEETVPAGTTDFAPVLERLRTARPAALLCLLGPSTSGFFKAYASSGWDVPVTGRVDVAAALAAAPDLKANGLTSITVFTPLLGTPGVQAFVSAYRARYGLTPTQRSFFVYEAVHLVADAIARAGTDTPAAIETALQGTTMPSRLGGTYKPDDHNHAHTPLPVVGLRDGTPAVVAME